MTSTRRTADFPLIQHHVQMWFSSDQWCLFWQMDDLVGPRIKKGTDPARITIADLHSAASEDMENSN